MPMFPAFIDIKGKKCVVIGGGTVAARKIETLLAFQPNITVISPEISEKLEKLHNENKIEVFKKEYSIEDIENAFMVIAATNNPEVNEKVCADAKDKAEFLNVIDSPENCNFIFPSVIARGELIIGISTSGSFPALSKRIREKLEEELSVNYTEYLDILKHYRNRSEQEIKDRGVRKELLGKILDEVLISDVEVGRSQLMHKIEKIFEEYKYEEGN